MKLSISIMAHPSRSEFVDEIQNKIGQVPVAWDRIQNVWDTCKRAWGKHDPHAKYHLVIQDDALVCDNFIERVNEAIEKAESILGQENFAMQLYFGNRAGLKKYADDGMQRGYVIRDQCNWGVAILIPTKYINEMVAFGNTMDIPQDDTRIKKFLLNKGIHCFYPMPSLIDHRESDSLVGDQGRGRRAWYYIDRDGATQHDT